ncbi:unnamed protein product [Macrosiphum euphorbiae]|uniref:Transposase domain-containing protein n=1 Tax=Macrosiphum euphorbiae TaxID=13131 RepID=A0AAV0XGV7_9HEMI|nr:unnamed protein product [Macrosiphum euphorbiae]
MSLALSKSTKRRRCLEEIEELGLAIDSNASCNNHNDQPSSSEQHIISHKLSNNISNECDPTSIFFASNHNEEIDPNLMADINLNGTNIFVSNFSSDSDYSDSDYSEKVLTNITKWAIQHKISNLALSDLLKVLKTNHKCFDYFPIDARTLLKTNVSKQPLQIQNMNAGIFHYFGLANGIKSVIGPNVFSDDTIKLQLGVDGLPLTKSTNSQFWPILCYISNFNNTKSCVFLVGLYWGTEKPQDSNLYLSELVAELKGLCFDGIDLPVGKKKVYVEAICADAPAISYILRTKGHTGFSSCIRCSITGVFLERRVCFPETVFNKRTHEEFLNRQDEDYQVHNTISILSEVPNIDMVYSFPLDYMHSVCLGVVKKNILLWLGTLKNSPLSVRLPSQSVKLISNRLMHLKSNITRDFARIPRGLNEVLRWKATEFRTFILYTGPVVLKSIISPECYEHFLCLHVSMTVLLSPSHGYLLNFIDKLLSYYVKKFGEIYGEEFLSHNLHALVHLCDDYNKFGPLDNCSCFMFENFMQFLKKMVRSKARPLEQVIKRNEELNKFGRLEITCTQITENECKNRHNEGPLIEGCSSPQFKIVSMKNVLIKIRSLSDCYIGYFNSNKKLIIMNVVNVCYHRESQANVFLGRIFNTVKPFYTKPIDSLKLGIASVSDLSDDLMICNINKTNLKKYMALDLNDDINIKIVFPILHSK